MAKPVDSPSNNNPKKKPSDPVVPGRFDFSDPGQSSEILTAGF